MMKNRLLLIISVFLLILSVSKPVFADDWWRDSNAGADVEIPLGDKLVLKDGTPVQEVFNSTDDMINLIVKVIFVGAGFFLFLMIIGAGFSLVQGDSKDKDKAKTTMTSAIIGFMIMFGAFWIMQIIQLITGINMGFN
jgi:hypothetical protein